MSDTFDYIIVGSGTGGSVLASRLSEDPKTTVLVLEAGGSDLNPYVQVPAGFMHTMVDGSVNWLYETEPGEGIGGRRIAQPRGKTLGGSSSINGHIYNRGQAMDFDVWAQMGNRGWSYPEVLPYFKRSERRIGDGDDQYRGRDGPFAVTDLGWRHPLCEAYIQGAVRLGIPRNPDYNGARQEGVGYFQRSIHRRRRMSAARAYLHPAKRRENLEIRTRALATAILFEDKRATGISYVRGGETHQVKARREVLLAGGTINTPQLLELSGIGRPDTLQTHGISVLHPLPGVGENFRDHYGVRLTARARNTHTINERSRGWRLGWEIAKYFLGGESILCLQPTLVGCFWMSDDALERADLQLTFTPASYKEGVQSHLDDDPGMTSAVWQHRPESTGYVHIRSADPHDKPLLQPNYLTHEIDQRTLVKGVRLARRLLESPELAPYLEAETSPGKHVASDTDILAYARERGTTVFHAMGTCQMGPGSRESSVVDEELKVHGLQALRIVDASIMPTMPSANTNASTLMIAEKACDLIRGREMLPAAALSS